MAKVSIVNVFFNFVFILILNQGCVLFCFVFLRFYLSFRERGRQGGEGEKHQCVVASLAPPTGHPACHPGMCPDWELNQPLFGSQVGTQSTEPHQPGLFRERERERPQSIASCAS